MKNCLICQTGQDQISLARISIKMEGVPWGDILVCQNCIEMLGVDEVKNLVGIAVKEKSFEASNLILVHSESDHDQDPEPGTKVKPIPGQIEMPVSAGLLRDRAAFVRMVGEKVGGKFWDMHQAGTSDAVWSSSLTPDGEAGFVLSIVFAPA